MALLDSREKLKTGEKAPYFILIGTDEKEHALKDYTGKPLIVAFICNHCPYVHAKIGALVGLKKKFGDDINIVGINSSDINYQGEGFGKMKEFVKNFHLNFDYLIDESQRVAKDYGAVCTPDPFLFDAEGKLVYHGRLDSSPSMNTVTSGDVMEDNINKLLNDEKVEKGFLPSQGCSIKWKSA